MPTTTYIEPPAKSPTTGTGVIGRPAVPRACRVPDTAAYVMSWPARSAHGPVCPQPVIRACTRRGLRARHSSGPRPSRSATPGRYPSSSTSASSTRRWTTARPASALRSTAMLGRDRRRPPASASGFVSPGRSTRTTSAPSSASTIPANGVGPMPPSSTTRMPASGPGHRGTPRTLTRGRPVAPDRRDHVDDPAGGPHVVGPEDGGPQPRGDGRRGERALEPVVGGEVERLADEVLARQGLQHGVAQRHDRLGVPQQGQRVGGRLAEVEGGVDEHPVGRHACRHRPLGSLPQRAQRVVDHPERLGGVGDLDRVGARRQPAGVRHHVAGTHLGRDVDELGVVARPGVVDEVDAGLGGRGPRDVAPPGVEAQGEVGMPCPRAHEERHDPLDLLLRGDDLALLPGAHPADVDDVGPALDGLVERTRARSRGRRAGCRPRTSRGCG